MTRIPLVPRHPGGDFVADAVRRSERPKSQPSPRRLYDKAVAAAKTVLVDHANQGVIWDTVQPFALVGLYILLHRNVYMVDPEDLLAPKVMSGAVSSAKRLIRDLGRIDWAFDFVRWTWAREAKQFAKRESDWRISWRYQFCHRGLVTDYRVAMSRVKVGG